MRTFSPEDEATICQMYKDGRTITFIRQYFHCRHEAIHAVLNKYEIPILKKGVSKNRQLKEDFFENIDCEEKAYFLGLLFTDGSVTTDKSGNRQLQIRLQLKVSDIDIIEKLRDCLKVGSKIIYDKREKKECAILSFRSKKMAEDLAKYGIVPNKTYLTKHLPTVPKEFRKDFLRGLIDGDGSIYQETASKKYRIDFCSYHASICEDYRQLCNEFLDIPNTNTIANYGTAYHLRLNRQELVAQLATVLYKDAKVALSRKQAIASNLF